MRDSSCARTRSDWYSPLLRSWQKPRFLPAETKLVSEKAPQATFSNESVQREMRVVYAGALERSHDAIEFRNVGNGTYAYSVHFAACDEVVADENLAVSAAAQFGG